MSMSETMAFHWSEVAEAAPFAAGTRVQFKARKYRPSQRGKT
jgi:hypothetical protein